MEPKHYPLDLHGISPISIDSDALAILEKLQRHGFNAYLVGGSVRDLLTGTRPKDFDISTSALPEQIKEIFGRSCILIGRRFRLAHIRASHKIFEVSTFRAGNIDDDELIVRDNEWGSPEQDAMRRDFSINGLFYDPSSNSVIDYVGGWEAIQERTLRSIGNPALRFRQDPVRMIRLLKFHARFGFSIASDCLAGLSECREEIVKSAPARVLEELMRMLESGFALPFFKQLIEHGFLSILIPSLESALKGPQGEKIWKFLETVDEIHKRNPGVQLERSILFAGLLFPTVQEKLSAQQATSDKKINLGDVMHVSWETIKELILSSFSHFPKRLASESAYIMTTQYRLTPPEPKKHTKIHFLSEGSFPLALKFLKIRALQDSALQDSYFHWEKLFREIVKQHGHSKKPSSRPQRRRRSRKPIKQ